MELGLIFLQILYFFICLEWGRIKGMEYLNTHSHIASFYFLKGLGITIIHTITAPISILRDLYKN